MGLVFDFSKNSLQLEKGEKLIKVPLSKGYLGVFRTFCYCLEDFSSILLDKLDIY
jgi:hypothetical protein